MITSDQYNSLVSVIVDGLEKENYIDKTKKIVCCTNGISNISDELESRGYDASEIPVTEFDGICDILIVFVNYSDFVKISSLVQNTTTVISLYRKILTSADQAQQDIIDSFFVGMVGEGISLVDDSSGKTITYPFDNRGFIYNFGA